MTELKPRISFPTNLPERTGYKDKNLIESHSFSLGSYKIIYEKRYETILAQARFNSSRTGNILESLMIMASFGSEISGYGPKYDDSLISINRTYDPKNARNEKIEIDYKVCSENDKHLFDTGSYTQDGKLTYYPRTVRLGNLYDTRRLTFLKGLAKNAGFLSKSDLPEKGVDVIKVAEKVKKACENAAGSNDPKLLLAGIRPVTV